MKTEFEIATDFSNAILDALRGGDPDVELSVLARQFLRAVEKSQRLETEINALWHFSTCPFDHCERCIADEGLIKSIGKRLPEG